MTQQLLLLGCAAGRLYATPDRHTMIEQINLMHAAVGSALSSWTRVEIQLFQLFGASHVLTIMQAGGGFSSDMRTPYRVLNSVDGFSAKMRMIDSALKSALGELDEEAISILNDWDAAEKKVRKLHNDCRNRLAHWTVASGFRDGAKVRLVPPPYSERKHQGVSITDIRGWERSFIATQDLLVNIVARLTSHQGLQHKLAMQTIEQVRIALSRDSALVEAMRHELQ